MTRTRQKTPPVGGLMLRTGPRSAAATAAVAAAAEETAEAAEAAEAAVAEAEAAEKHIFYGTGTEVPAAAAPAAAASHF